MNKAVSNMKRKPGWATTDISLKACSKIKSALISVWLGLLTSVGLIVADFFVHASVPSAKKNAKRDYCKKETPDKTSG